MIERSHIKLLIFLFAKNNLPFLAPTKYLCTGNSAAQAFQWGALLSG